MKGSRSIEVDLTFPISYFLPGLRCYEEVTLLSGLDLFLPMNIFFYVQKKILSTSYLYFLYTIGVPDFTWDFGSSRMASDLLTYNYLDPSYFLDGVRGCNYSGFFLL